MSTTISSVVLRARPDKLPGVRSALAAMPGVEVHADCEDGRLVLLIEAADSASAVHTYATLHEIDGVLNASLVYQYSDDALRQEPEA